MSARRNPMESNEDGVFLWGANVKLQRFNIDEFPLVQEFVVEIYYKIEMCDLIVNKISITKYENSYGVVALPDDQFKGVYVRGRIYKCGKCNGCSSMSTTMCNSFAGYEREKITGNAKTHELGCEYYLVQKIMEM